MTTRGRRQILATSGGFRADLGGRCHPGPVVDWALHLTGRARPRVCVLGTATGDDAAWTAAHLGALAERDVRSSHLALFPLPSVDDPEAHLLRQDLIWVSGGSTVNLLAVWRVHGLDRVMRRAWEAGVVLAGVSAGALCWFEAGTTDSFGLELRPVHDGLGLLPGSFSPHFDSEPARRPAHRRLLGAGLIPDGWAADDGAALHFVGTELAEVVTDREGSGAWRLERRADGGIDERRIGARRLG